MNDLDVIKMSCTHTAIGVLSELLDRVNLQYSSNETVDDGRCEFTVYLDANAKHEAEAVEAFLLEVGATVEKLVGERPSVPVRCVIRREDWAESWKRHFPVTRLSERVVVKPHWEDFHGGVEDVVLEIDPGMSFGTGHHGTTQACVQFLDELARAGEGGAVLDLGCGSGILSMAALALGFESVVAVDNDEQACMIARENLTSLNDPRWTVECSGVDSFRASRRFPVVVANILAVVLVEHAEAIVSHVHVGDSPSHLILSGILDRQFADVERRYADLGFQVVETKLLDEWRSGLLVQSCNAA